MDANLIFGIGGLTIGILGTIVAYSQFKDARTFNQKDRRKFEQEQIVAETQWKSNVENVISDTSKSVHEIWNECDLLSKRIAQNDIQIAKIVEGITVMKEIKDTLKDINVTLLTLQERIAKHGVQIDNVERDLSKHKELLKHSNG